MTMQQLSLKMLKGAESKAELAGTDILVLSTTMLRDAGLFPGEMRELRIQGEQPGQGIVCTLGLLEKGGLIEGPPCVGKELGSLLLKQLRSLTPTEEAILAAPLAESPLPPLSLEGILVQRPPDFRQEHDEALLRSLHAWLQKKRGINADMEYRWQANAWCLAQGNGQRGWGSIDLSETKVFFVSDWPNVRTAWVQCVAERGKVSHAQRQAQQAYTACDRLAEELLRRREGIATTLLRRAGILVCLARTADLLQTEFNALNLGQLTQDVNTSWHVQPENRSIDGFWTGVQNSSSDVSRTIPSDQATECSKASKKIEQLDWHVLQQSLPKLPALPSEPHRSSLDTRIGELIESGRQFTERSHNAEEKNGELETIKGVLDIEEDNIKRAIKKMNDMIAQDMEQVAKGLTSASEGAPPEAPWRDFLSRLAGECEQAGRTWTSIADNALDTWWQTLYGQDEPDHALANGKEAQGHYAASGLALLREITSLQDRFKKSYAALVAASSQISF